jgi:hypothetical protein
MSRPYRILVTGSREWTDVSTIEDALLNALYESPADADPPVLVHGGCPTGADAIADSVWRHWSHVYPELGFLADPEVHPADWARHGRSAGPIRNHAMVRAGADICLAFPVGRSPGTRGCMAAARAALIPVRDYGTPYVAAAIAMKDEARP